MPLCPAPIRSTAPPSPAFAALLACGCLGLACGCLGGNAARDPLIPQAVAAKEVAARYEEQAFTTDSPRHQAGNEAEAGNEAARVDTGVEDREDAANHEENRSSDVSEAAQEVDGEELPEPDPVAQPRVELVTPGELTSPEPQGVLLGEVIDSVHANFPLVEAAYLERDRTSGEQLAARGAFDTRVSVSGENQPLGFYETYRQRGRVTQPLYQGGDLFAGYRIGRGQFEPWYLERETNDGGELSAGFTVPLARNRQIDARRAKAWRANYDRQIAEPEIRRELISFVRDASVTYWEWVAAGQLFSIGRSALRLARERNDRLRRQVEEGDIDPPVLKDNQRAIAEREADLLDRRRRFEQAAVRLSLFLRRADAAPQLPAEDQLPPFPEVPPWDREQMEPLVPAALVRRPELESLDIQEQRLGVDLAEGANDLRPQIDAGVIGSQDVGAPRSPKRDKSQFELELGVNFELPVQRRQGFGKIRSARAKLAQLDAKRRFTVNQITTEVQAAVAALDAASGQVERTQEAVAFAEELAEIERIKFAAGQSELLSVFLREQFAIEAADKLVLALLNYHVAHADLMAALGNFRPDNSSIFPATASSAP